MKQNFGERHYSLLYFSPRPEDGEWVCIAVLINDKGKWSLEYDEALAKMMFLARERDPDFVRRVLTSMQTELRTKDLMSFMVSIEPQFKLSESRRLLVPPDDEVREELKRRFLTRSRVSRRLSEKEDRVMQGQINRLLTSAVPKSQGLTKRGLRPKDILGEDLSEHFKNVKAIARAVVGRTRAILIDGVDTSRGSSTDVIRRANRIGYTFWQYGKVRNIPNLPRNGISRIIRVGVVFDGLPDAANLRDYSLHQFEKDADIAIDARSSEGQRELKNAVEDVLGEIKL